MRREKKPIGRWIGEAVLIFLSVYGAFYFEDIRKDISERDIYIRHLKDFKLDLEQNQGKFNFELSNTYGASSGQGYILGNIKKYDFLDSLMAIPTRASADTLMALIKEEEIFGVTPWIFQSPQYETLNRDYYSSIKNDTLRSRIQMHRRNNESRMNAKRSINAYVSKFEDIEDQLNLKVKGTPANRAVLFSNKSINTIWRIGDGYETLKGMTENARTNDSLLIIQIDHELRLWGVSDN